LSKAAPAGIVIAGSQWTFGRRPDPPDPKLVAPEWTVWRNCASSVRSV